MSDSELSGEVKEGQESKLLQSGYISYGDKSINSNNQAEIKSYSHRSQINNVSLNNNQNNQELLQKYEDSSSINQRLYYVDQNQYSQQMNNYNNFMNDLKNYTGDQNYQKSNVINQQIENENYQLGYKRNTNSINTNFLNKENDIAVMMNSSIQSAQSQQIINHEISDDENERRLANNFEGGGGGGMSPDFKVEAVSTIHQCQINRDSGIKLQQQQQQQPQQQFINQYENQVNNEDLRSEDANEQKRQCDNCSEIPINYIALPCTHNFCINCLMQIYMNPILCKKDYDNFAELICQICSKPTKLDYESQIAIETEIQQSLINNMNEENPLQMITNPNLQLEDIQDQKENEISDNEDYHQIREEQFQNRENVYQNPNDYLQMQDSRQNQEYQQQQQQQYFQQRYQMPKEEVIHEEESMETFLTNETHKIIQFNSESPYQSLPKSSFHNKQLKSGYNSSNGNILTNSLLKALHNNALDNNNNSSNNKILYSDFKKSIENQSSNSLQFQSEDVELKLNAKEESGLISDSDQKNKQTINVICESPLIKKMKSEQQQQKHQQQQLISQRNLLKVEEENHDSLNNILEFRRVESNISHASNNILNTSPSSKQQTIQSLSSNREQQNNNQQQQQIQLVQMNNKLAVSVFSNAQLQQSLSTSKQLANSNQMKSQIKEENISLPSNINLLHSIQESQNINQYNPIINPQNPQNKDQFNSVHSNIQLLHSVQDLSSSNSYKASQKQQENSQLSIENKSENNQQKELNNNFSQQNRNLIVSEYILATNNGDIMIQNGNNTDALNLSQQNKDYMRLTQQTDKETANNHASAIQELIQSQRESNQQNKSEYSSVQQNKEYYTSPNQSQQLQLQMKESIQHQSNKDQPQQNNNDSKFLRTREQIKSGGKISYRSSRNSKSESMSENQFMQSLESNNINALSTNCNEHPLEDAQLFCFTCECKCICLTCQNDSIKHSGHQVENVMKSYNILQDKLDCTHNEIANKVEQLDSTYWNFSQQKVNVQKKYEEMQQQIAQMFGSAREMLQLKENELLSQLTQNQSFTLSIVDQECNKMQEARKTLETVSGKLNIIQNAQPIELTELADCTIAFNYFAECKRILNEIISKTKIDQEPIKQFENISLVIVNQIIDQIKSIISDIKFPYPYRDNKLSPTINQFIQNPFSAAISIDRKDKKIENYLNSNQNKDNNNFNQTNKNNNYQVTSKFAQTKINQGIQNQTLENISKFKQHLKNQNESPNYLQKKIINLDQKTFNQQQYLDNLNDKVTGIQYQKALDDNMNYQSNNNSLINLQQNDKQSNQFQISKDYFSAGQNVKAVQKQSPAQLNSNYYISQDAYDKLQRNSINNYNNNMRIQNNYSPQSFTNNKSELSEQANIYQINQTAQLKLSQLDSKDQTRESFSESKLNSQTNQNNSQEKQLSKMQLAFSKIKGSSHLQDEIEKINNSLLELQANIDLNQIFCKTEQSPQREKEDYQGYSERQQKINSNRINKKNSPYHAMQQQQQQQQQSQSTKSAAPSTFNIQKFFKNFQSKYDTKSSTIQNNQQSFSNKSNSDTKHTHPKLGNSVFSYSKKIQEQQQNNQPDRIKFHHKHLSEVKLNTKSINSDILNIQQSSNIISNTLFNDKGYNNNNTTNMINFNTNLTHQQEQSVFLPEKSVIDQLSAFQQDIKSSYIFQKELRKKEIDWLKTKTISLLKKSEATFQSQHNLNESEQSSQIYHQKTTTPINYRSNSNINLSKVSLTSITNNNNNNNINNSQLNINNYHSEGRKSSLSSNNLRSATPQQSSPITNYFNKSTYNSQKPVLNKFQESYSTKRLQKPKSFTSRNLLSMFDKSPQNDFFILNYEKNIGDQKSVMNIANHQNLIDSLNMISPINGNLNINNNSLI